MPAAVFADTFYWLALARPRDAWHARALEWSRANAGVRLFTTDEVLTEFLNAIAKGGPIARQYAVATVKEIRTSDGVIVLPQTRASFDAALTLYEARSDKEYSLTDCRSMVAMQAMNAGEALTNDHHFAQEGFQVLFPKE